MPENFWDDEEEHHPLGREGAIAVIKEAEEWIAAGEAGTRPVDKYDLSALYLQIGGSWLVPHDQKIELLGKQLWLAIRRQVSLIRVIKNLYVELSYHKGQLLNLEKRVFELEQRSARRKRESKY